MHYRDHSYCFIVTERKCWNGVLLDFAREGKFFAQPSIRITGRRKGARGVITAVVAGGMIWIIVCFQRKRS